MENKEEKIYNSAKKLFEKYGPKKVSIDSIISEAEVGKGTFYKYFSNKEALYKKIIDDIIYSIDKKEVEKRLCSLKEEEFIIYHFLGYLFITESNVFLKNIFLQNKDFYFGEINFDYIRKINYKMALENINFLKKFSEKEKILLVESIYSFVKICLIKKSDFTKEEYDNFCLKYANIFTFGYLQNKNFLEIDLKNFKENILIFKNNKNV